MTNRLKTTGQPLVSRIVRHGPSVESEAVSFLRCVPRGIGAESAAASSSEKAVPEESQKRVRRSLPSARKFETRSQLSELPRGATFYGARRAGDGQRFPQAIKKSQVLRFASRRVGTGGVAAR